MKLVIKSIFKNKIINMLLTTVINCGYYGPMYCIMEFIDVEDLHGLYCTDNNNIMNIIKKYITSKGEIFFTSCIIYGLNKFIKLLLRGDLDLRYGDNWPIRYAVDNNRLEIVKLLLADKRVDPTIWDNYVIGCASKYGHTEVVKLLLADPRVNPGDCENNAFTHASEYGHVEIVKLLLNDSRVDLSIYDYNLAIRYAAKNGHTEVVKILS